VVEDQEFQRNVLSNLLNRLGARDVHQADDGHGAFQ
jgi:CheY-like chemotaxis protein